MLARNASLVSFLLLLCQSPGLVVGQETPTVQRWRSQLQNAAPSYRAQAAYELSKLGSSAESCLVDLYDRLGDSDANVRLYSLHALGNIAGRPAETATRILPLLQDENEHVRYAAEWSLARIASLPQDQIADERLLAVFRQAIVQVKTREHHQRHRQVVENAVELLAKRFAVAEAPSRPTVVEQIALENGMAQLNSLSNSFEFSDRLGQLKIIDQLACFHAKGVTEAALQATQTSVLKQALLRSESLSVYFALQQWGSAGREALMRVFDALPENAVLPGWTSTLVESVEPRHSRDVERLKQIALQVGNPIYIRTAAVGVLGQACGAKPFDISGLESSLLAMVSNQDEEGDLRCKAMECLVQLGATNQDIISRFRSILSNEEEAWWVRMAAAKAIAKAAPETVAAVNALMEMVGDQSVEDYRLACVVETLACFENSANTAAEVWARALRSEDEFTKLAAAEAIASIGASIKDVRELQELLLGLLMDPDESGFVQVAAVQGLAKLGAASVTSFSQRLTAENDRANIRAFNALATLGPQATPALAKCIAVIDDEDATLAAKNAAALVVGQMGIHGKSAAPALRRLSRANIPTAMRASVVVALAQVGELPNDSKDANDFADDQTTRAAVKYARYSMGQTGELGALVAMLDQQEPNYAANALTDIGPAANQPLLKLLLDKQANSQHRIKALEVLLTIPQDNYQPLLASVADPEIGQACEQCISDAFLDGDRRILGDVVVSMRGQRQSDVVKRLEHIALALMMDVGAGGEGDAIEVDSALVRNLQQDALPQISKMDTVRFAFANSPQDSLQLEFPEPVDTMARTNVLGSANNFEAAASDSLSFAPTIGQGNPNQLAELDSNRTAPKLESSWSLPLDGNGNSAPRPQMPLQKLAGDVEMAASQGKLVKVFYGTNRSWSSPGALHGNSALTNFDAPQKLFALLAAVTTIAVCLFGFLRQKLGTYAVFAIGGLAVVGWFGLKNNLQYEHASVASVARQQLNPQYGSQLSHQLALGICEVSIPESHVEGELETASIFRLEFTQDAAKHVVLQKTSQLESEQFFQQLKGELHQKGKNLLVFVHGYNVSFEDAARRTAQMATDLDFAGAPVFFSWPSQANWYQYQQDKKNIELSVGPIKEFLLSLAQQSGAESIDLIAHSMGTVGLTGALAEMDSDQPIFNQVVLAAPDIDAEVFRTQIAPSISKKSRNTTLYASSTDLALVASRYFNSGKRAGDSSQPIALYPGVEVIDATTVDSSLLGHAYYGGSASVLDDLAELFMNRPAQQRTYLKMASVQGQPYWVFDRTYSAKQVGPTDGSLPTLR